jgi:succinate dehydrogenase / fumarate reductase cytochrome b subunit
MGLASILHRVSAVIIWVAAAYFLPMLYMSLESAEGFHKITSLLAENIFIQFFTWGFLTALGYYVAGGLKHIIQELGFFETLEGGRFISSSAIGMGVLMSFASGFWIWG